MRNRKRLVFAAILVLVLLALGPKKLGWLVPGPDGAVTGYVAYELFSGDGAHYPAETGVEALRAALGDTWVLWWGASNAIPMEDREDNPLRLEIYTDRLVPAAVFTLGSDGLLYAGRLRFRPLNNSLEEALAGLELQTEEKNGGDG